MNEPDWAKVLSVIYSVESSIPAMVTEDHTLIKNTDLDKKSVNSGLSTLRRHELIERNPSSTKAMMAEERSGSYPDRDASYILTDKGFDVSHERELKKESQNINFSLMSLTAILALTALIQAVSSVLILDGIERNAMLGGTIIILLSIVYIGYKSLKQVNNSTQ